MKSDSNKTSIKIAPASSIAVAAAKSVTSRDPRLKSATTGAPAAKSTVATPSAEEFVKQQQLLQQFKLHMQSKQSGDQSSLLNDAMLKGTSEPEKNKILDNKRAKDACQKKDPCIPITNATNALTSQRSNSIVKEQSKSSPSKSLSTRNSRSSKTSSSSSRKVGSKSRSKSSSNSPSPNKIAKLENSSPPSSDSKHSSSKKSSSSSKSSHKTHSPSPSPACVPSSNGSYRIPRRSNNAQDAIAVASSTSGKSSSATGLVEEEQSGSLIVSTSHPPAASFKELRSNTRNRNYIRRNKEGSRSPPEIIIDGAKDSSMPDASKDEDLRAPIVSVNVTALASLDTSEFPFQCEMKSRLTPYFASEHELLLSFLTSLFVISRWGNIVEKLDAIALLLLCQRTALEMLDDMRIIPSQQRTFTLSCARIEKQIIVLS